MMAKFSEVLTIVNGRNQKQVVCDDGKYPIYGSGGIMGYANDYICKAETVVIGRKGSINKPIFVETPFWNVDTAFGLCANSEKLNPKYLYYFCEKFDFEKLNTTVTIPSLTKSNLLNVEIPLPNLEKQKQIVELLDKVTSLIFLRKQQLAKLDELVKVRFVEMFGEPSSNPMGWLQTTVGAECYYIKDGPHKSLTDVGMENGYPFISVRNIVNGYIDFSTAKYISEADYKDAIKKCCPEKGDILYSKGGTTGIAKLVDIDIKFANWVHLAVLKFNHNEFNGSFFEKMLNCDYCYKQSQMLTKGIANRDLVLSAMAQIKIYKPPILLQNQFAAFVERVDQQKQTVQQSLEKLELMKKALMQEYFG